jgi:pimeloyl-ACP methyl ester carboxylesterase
MIPRADIGPGAETSPDFVGDPGDRVFRVTTRPANPPSLRVIVCPPVGGEAARNYRREVLLSRRLSGSGIETVRFHYRGSGHSDEVERGGFTTMLEDARTIADACEDATPTIWMGTRVGGSVAACMAVARPARGLIIWDPVHDPVAYFRDILRAQVFSAFRRDEAGTAPKTDLIGDLRAAGSIDLLGYRITASLLDELCGEHPLKALDMKGTAALLVDLRRKGDPRSETVRLGAQWEKTGAQVEVMGVALNEPWWYGARSGSKADDTSDPNQTLLDATAGFVENMERVTS